jgi:hypothetical protein
LKLGIRRLPLHLNPALMSAARRTTEYRTVLFRLPEIFDDLEVVRLLYVLKVACGPFFLRDDRSFIVGVDLRADLKYLRRLSCL